MKSLQLLPLTALFACCFSYTEHDAASFLGVHTTWSSGPDITVDPVGLPGPVEENQTQEEPHQEEHKAPQHDDGPPAHHGHAETHHEEAHHGHEKAAIHGHAEGGEHGEHHEVDKESLALAYFLMGGVGALMIIFHFASSKFLTIKLATWRVLNMTTSIFVAVLLYGTVKGLVVHTFHPGVHAMVALTLAMFLFFFVGTHFLLYFLKGGDETLLEAGGTVLAHICGFAAMYGFADAHEMPFFEEQGMGGVLLLIVVAGVVIAALAQVMDLVMDRLAKAGDGQLDEDEEKWIETCEEVDDDILCLAISFLVCMLVRFAIRGNVQPYEPGMVGNITQTDANRLLGASFFFALLVFLGAMAMMRSQARITHASLARRVTTCIQHMNSMTMAWCFLFWAEWQMYVSELNSTTIGTCLVIAVMLTLFGFATVLLLTFVQHHFHESKMMRRAMSSIELALGVLVGFSWERAFDVGFEEIHISKAHEGSAGYGTILVTLMSLGLFAIVAPAWFLHILPRALKLEAEAKKARNRANS